MCLVFSMLEEMYFEPNHLAEFTILQHIRSDHIWRHVMDKNFHLEKG